ncbi:MAG TPA: DsbE family thiol:disulfide interchange protein [Betaproteobacteria bacterium]|nr:DsbE family thiol:disulfide interchange protein [Betaproteobacteria bacterium]
MTRFLIPLGIFIGVAAFLFKGLSLDPKEVPSPLIGKAAPDFSLPLLNNSETRFANSDMVGKVWLLNVFASWCGPCLDEHPIIVNFARSNTVPVLGFNYKDRPQAAAQWLDRHGDPYSQVVLDIDGRIGLDYGVYGVPETFLIDREGFIRYKKIGPLTQLDVSEDILPLIEELSR